ncbi:hypothetical protein [Thalassotalea sp. G2M2-11]|uniref:hypothetical protein n=1 Tax=Thalassotalea sp. G2M2-11 TaxID=2787627 RepID=UPI0019CF961E|nr:hypothetical protein [Thalassotalea sp. G2M2-11]
MNITNNPYISTHKQRFTHHAMNLSLFKRVATVALWVSVIACLSLAILIVSMDVPDGDYLSILQSLTNSQNNLSVILLGVGIWLIGATAATTYVITLYSSFRVAGPLFRFARNLEFGHQHKTPLPFIKIRSYDYFQEECVLMETSINALLEHYQVLLTEVDRLAKLNSQASSDKKKMIDSINKIKALEARLTL